VRSHAPSAAAEPSILLPVSFRDRLIATLHALEPVLAVSGVMVVGSEVPNLLEPGGASTLVVSQDVDLAIPLAVHDAVKRALRDVKGLRRSDPEPSVWIPESDALIEANFLGMEPGAPRIGEAFVFEDAELPLLVFGTLGVLEPGLRPDIEGVVVPLPSAASLALEKLLTDRSGDKYDRDLLVVLGIMLTWAPGDEDALLLREAVLDPVDRWTLRANLTALSLLPDRVGMPEASAHRARIGMLLERLGRIV